MPHRTAPEILVPHTLRVLGHASASQIAALRSLPTTVVETELEDARAAGRVTTSTFGGTTSWHMTDLGRAKGEADLAIELDRVGGRGVVEGAHADFLPLNRRIGILMTQWQLRPTATDPMDRNDHRDAAHDDAVIRRLGRLVDDVRPILEDLSSVLVRFGIHQPRLTTALARAERGGDSWIDAPDVPSLNIVWIQLHEDLLATLGMQRGSDDPEPPPATL